MFYELLCNGGAPIRIFYGLNNVLFHELKKHIYIFNGIIGNRPKGELTEKVKLHNSFCYSSTINKRVYKIETAFVLDIPIFDSLELPY